MVAAQLSKDFSIVLVGRDRTRLEEVARKVGSHARVVVAASLEATVEALKGAKPAVVFNTIGPFTDTAPVVIAACAPGTHYVDVSNELVSFVETLAMHDQAVASKRTLVVGAGFGVLGTESVVLKLCEGEAPAARVRVDAMPLLTEGGIVGTALAETIVTSIDAGAQRYENGTLVPTRLGVDRAEIPLPDGTRVTTIGANTGDLVAAQRASGAPFAIAGSSELPAGRMVNLMMTMLGGLISIGFVRRALTNRLARVDFPPSAHGRKSTWGHARVEWADGRVKEGWLQTGDAMDFTVRSVSEVVTRLARGEGRPGAFTPGALFGHQLAIAAGAELIVKKE